MALLAIDRRGGSYQCFAPDVGQLHVIDHAAIRAPSDEARNVLVESARIARGAIFPLSGYKPGDYDALVFPGGFGVAKNLCTFAVDGPNCTVNPDAEAATSEATARVSSATAIGWVRMMPKSPPENHQRALQVRLRHRPEGSTPAGSARAGSLTSE